MKQIVFFGSIGVGKTTMGKKLASEYDNIQFIQEDLSNNPFLPKFYEDMATWGFHSSIAMLALMSEYYPKIDSTKDYVILDNGVEELIAYTNLEYEMGVLNSDEYYVYKKMYDNIVKLLPKVDLYVYFICDEEEALKRIKQRNRTYEQDLDLSFLKRLNQKYRDFVKTLPQDTVIVIDTTKKEYSAFEIYQIIESKIKSFT